MPKPSRSTTVAQFDHGYWYALELKAFARELGIPNATTLRKDELEHAIRRFLRDGKISTSSRRKSVSATPHVEKDVALGLRLDRRVVRYTNDATTKEFLEREAKNLAPSYRRKSGARYRLNRWREARLSEGSAITYRDLIEEYIRLSQPTTRFARVPHGRYINFMADFLAKEPGATRAGAIKAWRSLKAMDCPKTYRDWAKATEASTTARRSS